MKLYIFYFITLIEGNGAKECKMYFGDEWDIAEIARKLHACDDSFIYHEEFLMKQDNE